MSTVRRRGLEIDSARRCPVDTARQQPTDGDVPASPGAATRRPVETHRPASEQGQQGASDSARQTGTAERTDHAPPTPQPPNHEVWRAWGGITGAEAAARIRGRGAVLPRRVRVPFDQRVAALVYLLNEFFDLSDNPEQPEPVKLGETLRGRI
jgi:hypothetical protein